MYVQNYKLIVMFYRYLEPEVHKKFVYILDQGEEAVRYSSNFLK